MLFSTFDFNCADPGGCSRVLPHAEVLYKSFRYAAASPKTYTTSAFLQVGPIYRCTDEVEVGAVVNPGVQAGEGEAAQCRYQRWGRPVQVAGDLSFYLRKPVAQINLF